MLFGSKDLSWKQYAQTNVLLPGRIHRCIVKEKKRIHDVLFHLPGAFVHAERSGCPSVQTDHVTLFQLAMFHKV